MLEFSEVIAARRHVYCYLDGYFVARLTEHSEDWRIEIACKPCGSAPTRAEAEEVVRMWAARQAAL
jgi:L-ascorbate metabolism protein UlaG (beta-lactamase superfamily)